MTGRPLFPVEAVLFEDHPARLHARMCGHDVPTFEEMFGTNQPDMSELAAGSLELRIRPYLDVINQEIARLLGPVPRVVNRASTGLRPPSKWWAAP